MSHSLILFFSVNYVSTFYVIMCPKLYCIYKIFMTCMSCLGSFPKLCMFFDFKLLFLISKTESKFYFTY